MVIIKFKFIFGVIAFLIAISPSLSASSEYTDLTDDFEDGVFTDKWETTGGYWEEVDGTINSSTTSQLFSLYPSDYNEYDVSIQKITDTDTANNGAILAIADEYNSSGAFHISNGYIFRQGTGDGTSCIFYKVNNGVATILGSGIACDVDDGRYRRIKITSTNVYFYDGSDGTTWTLRASYSDTSVSRTSLKAVIMNQDVGSEWDNFYALNWTKVNENMNATQIFDNSTSHFFEFNTAQNLNFTAINSTGDYVPQLLTLKIDDLGIEQNFTAGTNISITFNNESINNYTIFVYNPFNTSVNLTTHFYTVDIYNFTFNYSENLLIEDNNTISYTYMSNILPIYTISECTIWDNTLYYGNSNDFTVYNISGENEDIEFYANVSVSFLNTTLYFISDTYNQTIYYPFLDNCSSYNTYALNVSFKDEVNKSLLDGVDGNIKMYIHMNSGNDLTYYFSFENSSTIQVCMTPSWATYNFSAEISYEKETYYGRDYYYRNSELSNDTSLLDLYLLSTGVGNRIDFKVYDQNNDPLSDYYILIKRWYADLDSYIVSEMTKTNYEGEASAYIEYSRTSSIYYEIQIEDENMNPVYTISKQKYYDPIQTVSVTIISSSYNFIKSLGNYIFTSNINEVRDGNTTIFTATITDTTGNSFTGGVEIEEYDENGNLATISCNNSATSSSITTSCDLGNTTNKKYFIKAYIYSDETKIPIFSEWIDFKSSEVNFSNTGIIIGIMLIGMLMFIGMYIAKDIGAVLGYIVSILILKILPFIQIGENMYFVLLSLGFVIMGVLMVGKNG